MSAMYWISGNYYDKQKQWRQIVKSAAKEVEIEVHHCCGSNDPGYSSASEVISSLKNRDLFNTTCRIIKLKGIPHDYALLEEYLSLCDEDNLLVIDGPTAYRSASTSKRMVSVKNTKFYKKFKKNGKVLESDLEAKKMSGACQWVKNVIKEIGEQIEPDAAELLVQLKGKSYDVLFSEMSKIVDYNTERKITKKTVEDCCVSQGQKNIWDLIDYLDKFDYDAVMKSLYSFYDAAGMETASTFYGDIYGLLGAIHHHYLFLVIISHYAKQGMNITPSAAKQAFDGLSKKNGTDAFSPQYINFALSKTSTQHLSHIRKSRLYFIYFLISECQSTCRVHSNNKENIKLFINLMMMGICNKLPIVKVLKIYRVNK